MPDTLPDLPPLKSEWISGHAIVPEWPVSGGAQRVVSADEAEAALKACREAALEEAASACESIGLDDAATAERWWVAGDCATAIRALKDKQGDLAAASSGVPACSEYE